MKYKNLGDMFFSDKNPEKVAYKYTKEGKWISVTFKEAIEKVEQLVAALSTLGVQKGDKVAIMSHNKIEWAYSDYAVVSLGAILVPIYPTLMAEQACYILNDSESKMIIVSDAEQAGKINSIKDKLNYTKDFYLIDCNEIDKSGQWKRFDNLYNQGKSILQDQKDLVKDLINSVKLESVATIIYTSGTTGEPKGAVLTHKNFLSNIESATKIFAFIFTLKSCI
ncbi:MAG: AMP-binding protein [Calditrichia bacterium]|nr:AMP-binding protein [Calditrichia bacterium]